MSFLNDVSPQGNAAEPLLSYGSVSPSPVNPPIVQQTGQAQPLEHLIEEEENQDENENEDEDEDENEETPRPIRHRNFYSPPRPRRDTVEDGVDSESSDAFIDRVSPVTRMRAWRAAHPLSAGEGEVDLDLEANRDIEPEWPSSMEREREDERMILEIEICLRYVYVAFLAALISLLLILLMLRIGISQLTHGELLFF